MAQQKDDPFGFGSFSEMFDTSGLGKTPAKDKKPEKGIPWNAKKIDGKFYVPLEQVAELLKENDVLPAVCRGIERRVALNDLTERASE